jgi:dihydroneopterin aldolase
MAADWTLAAALGMTGVATRTYRVFVRNLIVPCRIGIYDFEKQAPQTVRVNAELAVVDRRGGLTDDFEKVFNYETVVEAIKTIARSGHIQLVETLGEMIAASCLEDERVESVRVRVEKLDVYQEAEGVGIEIERYRQLPADGGRPEPPEPT